MIPRLLTVRTTDPFLNLAREEWLLFHAKEGDILLYLWQNERTVVIGRNQDAFTECDLAALERDGGHLARRLSGGGAVYHDLGNLNFTFLHRGAQDVPRHLAVIRRALEVFGIRAEISGRNDLTAGGAKFSGSAYYRSGDFACHHGTLLVRTDLDALQRYLTPDRQKLAAKGVASVRSRVTDLTTLCPSLTVSALRKALEASFEIEYGQRAERLPETLGEGETPGEAETAGETKKAEDLKTSGDPGLAGESIPKGTSRGAGKPEKSGKPMELSSLAALRARYADEAWRFRPAGPDAYHSPVLRLPMGLCRLRLWEREGRICEARLETDALENFWSERTAEALTDIPLTMEAVRTALEDAGLADLLPLLSRGNADPCNGPVRAVRHGSGGP